MKISELVGLSELEKENPKKILNRRMRVFTYPINLIFALILILKITNYITWSWWLILAIFILFSIIGVIIGKWQLRLIQK
jgi:fatty acid desaturase